MRYLGVDLAWSEGSQTKPANRSGVYGAAAAAFQRAPEPAPVVEEDDHLLGIISEADIRGDEAPLA